MNPDFSLPGVPPERFRRLADDERDAIRDGLRAGFDRFPMEDEFQEAGRARIARALPLFAGPARTPRLGSTERPSTLLFDPELPDRLLLALGWDLPPQLWPVIDPAAVARDTAFYLERDFTSAHKLTRTVRLVHGSLEELGLESLDQLANVIGHGEGWIDGVATWRSAQLDDPWPADPSKESMVSLRVLRERAADEHGQRWPSVSMRTLWSRSVLMLQQGPFDHIVLELRYDPAPPSLLAPDKDLPADLLAVLMRGSCVAPDPTASSPYNLLVTCLCEPAENSTYALLRRALRDPQLRAAALQLAEGFEARSLLHELECETDDDELRARLADMNQLRPPAAAADEDGDEDDADEDEDEADDDYEDDEAGE